MEALGDISGIVHDLNTDEIVGGNQRSKIIDINTVEPVLTETFDEPDAQGTVAWGFVEWNGQKFSYRQVRWNDDQRERANITANSLGGEWDWDMLKGDDWDLEKLTAWDVEIPDDPEPVKPEPIPDEYEEAEVTKTDIKPGDLIEFKPKDPKTAHSHRLLCGDSTDFDDVDRLMNGNRASLVFTDPPYGVNVKGGKQKGNTIAGDLTQTVIPFSFEIAVTKATTKDARLYFCGGEGKIGLYHKLFDRWLAQMPKMLVWVKNGFVMKPNGYHNQYELIFFGFKSGGGGQKHWFSGRTEQEASDVWQVKRDATGSYLHPTQKPTELAARAIRNSTHKAAIVFEPFSGSASTMVACEVLGRSCYAMEIDPIYCQKGINRMLATFPEIQVTVNGKPYKTPAE